MKKGSELRKPFTVKQYFIPLDKYENAVTVWRSDARIGLSWILK